MAMRYFEDVNVGDTFASRSAFLVTAEEIKNFAGKWDPQRYHLDEKEAERVVGRLFAPLMLTLSISIKLVHDTGFFEIQPVAGLGMEDVRLPKPVFVDDELKVRVTVVAKRDSKSKPDLGLLSQKTELFNQHGDLVVSYVVPSLVYRRPV